MVSLFIFPTGPTALDSEPHGRRYAKNTRHDRNRLYSRANHCPASIEKHYIQWFLLKNVWFPYSSFQQIRQPSIPRPVEEDTSKIWYTIGTVFIQGPSIVLLVWRCIMFNGSYLRACRILRFVNKILFCLLESGRTMPWCPGLVSRPSAKS